jgi:SAM-dependent methyltransferase
MLCEGTINQFARFVRKQRLLRGREKKIRKYVQEGRKPWTSGYSQHREQVVKEMLNNQELLKCFSDGKKLPEVYGYRLDERVVEFPWVCARLGCGYGWLLDAGSALNFQYILENDGLKRKNIVIYTLSPETVIIQRNISYIYGDLRQSILKDGCFDEIVCISTLEHIGMDNTALYSKDNRFAESRPDDYQIAVKEFYRLMKPGGKLYITVPYGRYFDHGWLQVFDAGMVDNIIQTFNGSSVSKVYYRYLPEGWQISSADDCAECTYFDIHKQPDYDPDYAAAARAVVCLELTK